MSKRYSGKAATERIPAGGDYEEWFDVRTTAGLGDTLDMSDYTTNRDRVSHLLAMMIVDWSLVDKTGVKLAINTETIAALDLDLIAPVVVKMNDLSNSFLALGSQTVNPK